MSFALAQVFYVDPSLVQQATSVSLDRIDLYFSQKPQANNNKSAIQNPGVTVFLTTTANNVPQLPQGGLSTLRWSRMAYPDIIVSNNAGAATTFRFDPPVPLPTNHNYAMIVQFDGDEDFGLWKDITGQLLIGTQKVSTGPSTKGIGPYYDALTDVPILGANNTSNSLIFAAATAANTGSTLANSAYTASSWQAKSGTALKFDIYVARYTVNGNTSLSGFVANSLLSNAQIISSVGFTTTANGEIQYNLPQDRFEYLAYDRINSAILNVNAGERVFPILPLYPPGQAAKVTLNCNTGSNTVTATGNVNFSSLFNITANQPNYIIICSNNALGPNATIVNVRQVTGILSNTQIALDLPLNFTNAVANFWVAPIAIVDQFKTAKFFGNTVDVVMAKKSNANTSTFFTPFSVNSVTITANGTGYSNSDVLKITGHNFLANKILNAYQATANIVTNANGSLTGVYLANVGSGFSNIANVSYVIANSSGSNSVGTGANLSISIGTNLITEFLGYNGEGGNFANARPIDIDIGRLIPALLVSAPSGTYYNASMRFPYYSVDDSSSPYGRVTYCDADGNWDSLDVETTAIHYPFEFTKRRTLPSWSDELFAPYANGTSSGGLGGTTNTVLQGLTSNASVITITSVSNNDFSHVATAAQGSKVTFSRYILNNDYTAENTNYGNAWAKGIEVSFNLAANTLAEDLRVFGTVYQPANTKVLCFARIYNTNDNDAFDAKDWTMLQLVAGANVVSSLTNQSDVYELQWGFPQYPNTAFQITGTVSTTNGSQTVTGSNTNFSNLVSGDLVVITNNLFPNNYMVSVVNVVTNSTALTISDPIANLNLVGSGFTMAKIAYPFQAFNNYLNDNVVRYYSSTKTQNDGFNACAIKLVMLSANNLIVPLINDVRAVAVSA